jgi:hypothetical protein
MTMKYTLLPYETAAKDPAPLARLYMIKGNKETGVIKLRSYIIRDWGRILDEEVDKAFVAECKNLIFDVKEMELVSGELVACFISAWRKAIERAGSIVIAEPWDKLLEGYRLLGYDKYFNIIADLDSSIDWFNGRFQRQLQNAFPRRVFCQSCGTTFAVNHRNYYSCNGCAQGILVTEKGEIALYKNLDKK